MKRKLKLALASACVVAAGFGGMKAYNVANQSETDLLLAENVEALSNPELLVSGRTNKACSVQVSRGMMITKITGNVKAKASLDLSIGKIIDGGVISAAAGYGLYIEGKAVDTYRQDCLDIKDANCACVPTGGWIPCGSSGCPKAGVKY